MLISQRVGFLKWLSWMHLTLAFAIGGFAPNVARPAEPVISRGASLTVDAGRKTITIDEGISLRYSKSWTPSGIEYRNAVELISKGVNGIRGAPEARAVITVERRLSHDEAINRLAEIASTHRGTVTYQAIGGWPAMQLRYREPLPQATEKPGQLDESRVDSVEIDKSMAAHITTAIAVQDMVVRLDTTVAPKVTKRRVREAQDVVQKAIFPPRSKARDTLDELRRLRKLTLPSIPKATPPPNDSAGSDVSIIRAKPRMWEIDTSPAVALVGGFSETEAGVSTNGLNMIVGSNGGASISNNGGATFTSTPAALPFPNQGDPSIAIGRSGNFYLAMLGLPGATSTAAPTGCSASVISSGNNGAVFAFVGNAALCPATGTAMCFPDQEHIAADRTNASPSRGDQLYAVWRNFGAFNVLGIGLPANCNGITQGNVTPSLSCSTNSGSSWSIPVVIGGGDIPRVSVGQDGFVYVVIRDGGDIMVHKYSSCSNGLFEIVGFPRRVLSGINDPTCPLAGLDRCHSGLIVPTLAVDDTSASHLYVAVTKSASGSSANDDIIVIDSVDGGLTWQTPIVVNGNVSARRFMPWICAAAGNAYVGWYDRRAAAVTGATSTDLTDFFLGSATTRNGRLVSDGERNLTGTADAQCASGWPGAPDDQNDSERCTVQPQLAGRCQTSSGGGSSTRCDYSSGPTCPSGESCRTGAGAPKYGDYNGIACGPDRVLATWASATAPFGFTGPPPTGIRVFADVETVNGNLTVVHKSIPATDPGRFNVLIDGTVVSSSIANAVFGPISIPVTVRHQISESAAAGTSLSNYSVSITGDCDSDGTVHFSALHPAACRITNVSRAYQGCLSACNVAEGTCMSQAHSVAERQQCIQEKMECADNCSRGSLTVVKRIVPSSDSGKFDLTIDEAVQGVGAGNGDSTEAVSLEPGVHSVGEAAVGGASLSNYTVTIGGDCGPTGDVALKPGDQKICEITNTRKPGTGADAHLTVTKILIPATDPGRFDLRIDGITQTSNVGNGGSTGSVVVTGGMHTVDELGNGASLSSYIRTFAGDCNAAGSVTLAAGDNKICTITNRKNLGPCLAACNVAEGQCMSQAHSVSERQQCIQDKNECAQQCN